MSWRWQVAEGSMAGHGADTDDPALDLAQAFPSQGDAESWLGESYPELRSVGVLAVSLYEDARLVYGPMSLDP